MNAPTLWSSLCVQLPEADEELGGFDLEHLCLWLSRSKQAPLSFSLEPIVTQENRSVYLRGGSAKFFEAETAKKFAELLKHFHRWEYAGITFDSNLAEQYLEHLIFDPPSPSTRLECIKLGFEGYTKYIHEITRSLSAFPKLRRVELFINNRRQSSSDEGYISTLPWVQFTHVELWDEVTQEELLLILSQCDHVVEFKLGTVIPSPLPVGNQAFIPHPQLPHLRSLTLEGRSNLGHLLDTIPWVGLTRLDLKLFPISMIECVALLSKCSRVEDLALYLKSPHLQSEVTTEIVLPNVTSFSVSCSSDMGSVVKYLTMPNLLQFYFKNKSWDTRTRHPGWKEFEKFLVRSSCQLQKLDFIEAEANLIDCMEISSLRSLRELRIFSRSVSKELVAKIQEYNVDRVMLFHDPQSYYPFRQWGFGSMTGKHISGSSIRFISSYLAWS